MTQSRADEQPPAARAQAARYLIVAMLFAAAALDLTRCGLVMTTARQPAPAAEVLARRARGSEQIWRSERG
jgi:hypothetical protein